MAAEELDCAAGALLAGAGDLTSSAEKLFGDLAGDAVHAIQEGRSLLDWVHEALVPTPETFAHIDTLANPPDDYDAAAGRFRACALQLLAGALAVVRR